MNSDANRRARFQSITDEVYEPLQRYLRRRTDTSRAEDLLSSVMLTVWRRLDDVPTGKELPWCYGVARRTLANERRSQQRQLRLVELLESQPRPPSEAGESQTLWDVELATALDALGEDDREVLRLWAWEQLEPREMAQVLGVGVNAATLRLSRARKRLAHEMTGQSSALSGHEPGESTRSNDD